MKKSNLLLSLGAISIATIPAFAIVSCSSDSSDSFKLSSETQKIYDNLFDPQQDSYGEFNNKASDSLWNANTLGSKTEEEVKQIAKEHIEKMSDQDWKNIILNTALKSAWKGINNENTLGIKYQTEYQEYYDIDNVHFEKTNTNDSSSFFGLLFFDYITLRFSKFSLDGQSVTCSWKEVIRVQGLKVIPSSYTSYNKIFPVISFDEQQDNLKMTVLSSDIKASYNDDILRKMYDTVVNPSNNPYAPTFEEFISAYHNMQNISQSIKNLGDNLGKVNGKLEFDNLYRDYYAKSRIFDLEGYVVNEQNIATTYSIVVASPIFFSKLEGNDSFTWEVYELLN